MSTDLFIAARRVEHDGSRRVVAAGTLTSDGGLSVRGPSEAARALGGAVLAGRLERARLESGETAAETAS